MASGNRVEELESKVQELEATVDGLSDELIECKVRVRELENVVDAEVGLDNIAPKDESEPEADLTESADESTADTHKTEAAEGADNAESEESDIIIA